MMFCEKCGSIMVLKGEGKKKYMACPKCNFKKKDVNEMKLSEKIEQKEKPDVEVVEEDVETHPVVDKECSKCGNGKAFFWTLQTRAGDEPETEFYKCTKCKHQWRENN